MLISYDSINGVCEVHLTEEFSSYYGVATFKMF